MINILRKTRKEIEMEILYKLRIARNSEITPKRVCETYLLNADGTRTNTSDLTEEQIMALIEEDIQDFLSPTGSYKESGNTYLSSFSLIFITDDSWTPSIDAILHTYDMEKTYGHIIVELREYMDRNNIIGKAIAELQKKPTDDLKQPTQEEIIEALKQMSINEEKKKQEDKALERVL